MNPEATKIANTMLAIDMVLSLLLANEAGQRDLLSLLFAMLPPAWAALVLAILLSSVRSIRPTGEIRFPMNLTYPVLSTALVYCTAVLASAKSPSIVALESEASSLFLWTYYPFAVVSTILKIAALSLMVAVAGIARSRRKTSGFSGK